MRPEHSSSASFIDVCVCVCVYRDELRFTEFMPLSVSHRLAPAVAA